MIVYATEASFKEDIAKGTVLVDFYADWCGPCQMLGPILESASEKLPEGAKIVKVNVDEAPSLSGEYNVMSIPTMKIFKDGNLVDSHIGVLEESQIIELINKNI